MESPYKVPMSVLEQVHVALEDQVEEQDVSPPVPDLKAVDEREREALLRCGGAVY